MIKPEDIKVNVTFTEGYAQRFTAACIRQLEMRRKKSEVQTNAFGTVCSSAVPGLQAGLD